MNKNDWYNTESWYEPPAQTDAPAQSFAPLKKKRRWKSWQVFTLLGLLLLVGSSLAFAGSGSGGSADRARRGSSDRLPDDWTAFFDDYYTGVDTDIAEIDIPRAALFPGFTLQQQSAEGEELELQALYAECVESIVGITGYVDGKSGYFWGTGVVLSEDGLILTNTHVINECDRATVTLSDDSSFEAKLVGADAISDIAVLKIEARGLKPASFGESGALKVGEHVAAIGNPLSQNFRSTLTDGIISAIERGMTYNGHVMTLLQTNAALNEGNSGGALFNMHGQVVGITNMKMMSAFSSIEGIGFAIPSATVCTVVNSIVRTGEMRGRPAIGVTVGSIPENAASHYELPEGLYVSAVTKGSDAEAKGVRVGDIITEVNHSPVRTTDDISAIKNALEVGDSLSFTIWREGETLELEIVLMDLNDIYG